MSSFLPGVVRAMIFITVAALFLLGDLINNGNKHNRIVMVNAKNVDRSIVIMNKSNGRVDVHWVHASTGELVKQIDPHIVKGASQSLNSFVGHKFQATELPGKRSKVCDGENNICRFGYFTVNENHNQGNG